MITIHFDEKCVPNHEFVVIRIIDNAKLLKAGNIILSEQAFENEKLAFGKIEAVGKTAAEEYCLKPGQYCLFDRLATFYHTEPVCIVRYNNVIVLTNENRSDYFPVGGTLFVDETKDSFKEKKGVFVANTEENEAHTGKIVKMNLREGKDDFPFKLGDEVMLVKGADMVKLNGKQLYIYKPESVIVKIANEEN